MSGLIGVDWGSTNLRAFRYAADGAVTERRTSPRGIVTMGDGDFEGVLAALLDGWLRERPRIVLAGMVGSRNGWREAPYLPCPADPRALAAALTPVESDLGACFIVPGLSAGGEGTPADAMRGEETQLLGAGIADGTVVMPGTHSKWAVLRGGRIEAIRTAMTGELYALLLDHSLLGRLIERDTPHDVAAFALGVERARAEPRLSTTLFSVRAEVLTGGLAPAAARSYLSGLLIGSELAAMATWLTAPLTIIGDTGLVARYREALALLGIAAPDAIDGDAATAAGIWLIGKDIA